ncbi:efflux RND transporter periplasmic adaptor subunit [Pseudoalteromonas arctica]|uniref:Efflux RND transporter periplasmic adaptor subunit n=1 Tax=Pseudoalteromonas arctica TaxID=394751 RepID=A0A7Y0DRW2_9GAMM|nr:efflux RND transporter periplasmic adaptor subunit [Pseudoalteromonas arctica]
MCDLCYSGAYQAHIDISGIIKASKTLTLINESPGRITKLHLQSGGITHNGDTLLEIEHEEEKAQLQIAKSRFELQNTTVDRYKSLHSSSKISTQQLDESIALLAQYKAEINLLTAKIAKKIITAPFTARIGIHDLQIGLFLPINTSLTQLVGIEEYMWVDFLLPQTYSELAINTTVELTLLNDKSTKITAKVVSVAPAMAKHSRQLKYRAKVAIANNKLNSNQLVQVKVPIGSKKAVVAIPYLSVIKDQLGNYVYLLNKDSQGKTYAKRSKVELGERIGDLVMITGGLKSGTLIASQGAFKLRDGLRAHLLNSDDTVAMEATLPTKVSL